MMTISHWAGLAFTGALVVQSVGCGGAEGRDSEEPASFQLVELQRFGSIDGSSALTSVAGLVLADGEFYVLEVQPPRIVQFNLQGGVVGSFGTQGQGPGEFTRPGQMGGAKGLIWVSDIGARDLELFSRGGESVGSLRVDAPTDSSGAPIIPRAYLSSDRMVAGPGAISIGPVLSGRVDHAFFYLTDRAGQVLDTLYRAGVPQTDFVQATLPGGMLMIGGHPVREAPLEAFFADGSGMVVVERWEPTNPDEGSYRLMVWNPDGELETDRSISYVPLSAQGWQELHSQALLERGEDAPEQILSALREAWSDRAFFPPVTQVVAGYDGAILVRREETNASTVHWELFNRAGEHRARLTLPRETQVLTLTDREVWTVVRDELDVPYVVRSRFEEL